MLAMRDIGLPESNWSAIESELHRAVLSTPHDPEGAREAAQQVCLDIIDAMEAEQRVGNDTLIDQLLRSEIDGAPVSPEDIVSMLYLLLLGTDPTSTLTATALWHLARNPDQRAALVRDRTRIAEVADEFVRWVSPVQGTFRTMKTDDVIGGQQVCAGHRMLLSWASANRDENVFDRPDDVILDRDTSKHVAFGGGPHYCLGAPMVRLMFTVMVEEVLARLPDYEVIEEGVEWFPDLSSIYGIRALPIRFGAAGNGGTDAP
jgi:cytochrome P450